MRSLSPLPLTSLWRGGIIHLRETNGLYLQAVGISIIMRRGSSVSSRGGSTDHGLYVSLQKTAVIIR